MKKGIIFAFLFMFVFTLPALAYPDLSECETLEEAYAAGYFDGLQEAGEIDIEGENIPSTESAKSELFDYNAYIKYSESGETMPYEDFGMEDAYDEGYGSALVDFDDYCAVLYHEAEEAAEEQELYEPEPHQSYTSNYTTDSTNYSDDSDDDDYLDEQDNYHEPKHQNNTLLAILGVLATAAVCYILFKINIFFDRL